MLPTPPMNVAGMTPNNEAMTPDSKSAEGNLVGVRPSHGTNKINGLPNQRIFGCVFLCPNPI